MCLHLGSCVSFIHFVNLVHIQLIECAVKHIVWSLGILTYTFYPK